jgi:hypothetical protein
MGQLRFMMLNYSDTPRKFTIRSPGDPISILQCSPTGKTSDPDEITDFESESGKPLEFKVPDGLIWGFIADDDVAVTVDIPDENIFVITAADKNPWPPPPPPPQSYKGELASQFKVRFSNFNRGNPGGDLAPTTIEYAIKDPASANSARRKSQRPKHKSGTKRPK